MDLKETLQKAHGYDDLINDIKFAEAHCKGYIYDSLIYRYKLAREKAMNYDLLVDKQLTRSRAAHEAERDVMRFIQILDEVIDEHD